MIHEKFININGQIFPAGGYLLPDKRAFGLFETMLLDSGGIFLSTFHWQRLFRGIDRLRLPWPANWNSAFLLQCVLETARSNKLDKLCRVRLQTFQQTDTRHNTSFLIECVPVDAIHTEYNSDGWEAGLAKNLIRASDSDSDLKLSHELVYPLAAVQARESGLDDVLIMNDRQNIIESSIANIFWVKDKHLFTVPVSEGCVDGTMRRFIMEYSGYKVVQQPLTVELLHTADELFLTNSVRKIKWIHRMEGQEKCYGNDFSKQLFSRLRQTDLPVL